jgi:hypothetical protein
MPPGSAAKGTPMTEAPILPLRAGSPLRTPRSAAVAGIIFSVLLIATLVLLRVSVPAHPAVPGSWLTDPRSRTAVAIALNLVPFAGIAFLWFVGVLRDRIGEREDRFFATVFLGSGLLFVGMLFVGAAIAGGIIAEASSSGTPGPDTLALGRSVTGILLNIYAMRMAAVFTLTTVTIARRRRARERAGAAGRRRYLTLARAAVPGLDPGPEHRHPRGRPAKVAGQRGNGAPLIGRARPDRRSAKGGLRCRAAWPWPP